jgi:glutathione S-transferase
VHRWLSIPADKPDFPELTAYHERLKGRVAGARWMSDATP